MPSVTQVRDYIWCSDLLILQVLVFFPSSSHHITESIILTLTTIIISQILMEKQQFSFSSVNLKPYVKMHSLSLLFMSPNVVVLQWPNFPMWSIDVSFFSNLHFLFLLVWISGIPLQDISRCPSAFTGRNFRSWLLELRNSHSLIKSSRSALIDRLLEGYDSARHGTGVCTNVVLCDRNENSSLTGACYWFDFNSLFQVFGEAEFLEYQQALDELADV